MNRLHKNSGRACVSESISDLTMLVGHQEEHTAGKKLSDEVQCGYLSGARCRLFAHGPADANDIANPVISSLIQIQTGFTFLVLAYSGCARKEVTKWV